MVCQMESVTIKRKCFICDKEVQDGIDVLGKFICEECQKRLINLSPFDKNYDFYRQKMIDIWEDYMKDVGYENWV